MSDSGRRLIESAQQALDFAKGKVNTEDYRVHIPDEKPETVCNTDLPATQK